MLTKKAITEGRNKLRKKNAAKTAKLQRAWGRKKKEVDEERSCERGKLMKKEARERIS